MKIWVLAAILMIALMVGCAAPPEVTTEGGEAAVPEGEEVPPAPAEGEEAAEEVAVETEWSEAELTQIDLLKAACGRGSVKSCLALKARFGIEMEVSSGTEEAAEEEEEEAAE